MGGCLGKFKSIQLYFTLVTNKEIIILLYQNGKSQNKASARISDLTLLQKLQPMNQDILAYNNSQTTSEKEICNLLAQEISKNLPEAENKIWHRHPVWFLDGNPIVGYSKQKEGWRLMFWSGADFEEEKLNVTGSKFKDASIFYTSVEQINTKDLKRWLEKGRRIQWDYKNIVKRKGLLERLK